MRLTDKLKTAMIKGILEKGFFDIKKLMEFDANRGTIHVYGTRSAIFATHDFAVLHEAVEKLAGNAGPAILRTQGEESGRIDVRKAWRKSLEGFGVEFEPSTVFSMFPVIQSYFGWGKIIFAGIDKETGQGTLLIENCFEADAILEIRKGPKEKPQCHFITGYLKGFFSEVTGKKLNVVEVKCKTTGDERCEFQINLAQ